METQELKLQRDVFKRHSLVRFGRNFVMTVTSCPTIISAHWLPSPSAEYDSGIATLAATISRGSKGYSAVNLSSRIFSSLELLLQHQPRPRDKSSLSEFTGLTIFVSLFTLLPTPRPDFLCHQIFTNSLPILSSDFNLQSYFCDFSSPAAVSSPPQEVYGYETVVNDLVHKCLPWKISQQLPKNLKFLQMKPCRG
jgi:hypothetical protein